MKFQKETIIINNLFSIADFGGKLNTESAACRSFGTGKHTVVFKGFENSTIYQEQIELLFDCNRQILETYTFKSFEQKIINLLRILHKEQRLATTADIDVLYTDLLSVNILEFEVFYALFGGTLNSPTLRLGEFTIYNLRKTKEDVFNRYSPLKKYEDFYFQNSETNLLIGIVVKAREQNKASEIADNYLRSFDNIMSYAIGDLSHRENVGIFNLVDKKMQKSIVCHEKVVQYRSHTENISIDVNLDDPGFIAFDNGMSSIWTLITKPNKTEMERRILTSAEWIGKAVMEKDYSKSLFQFVVAIEAMLQFHEKTIISPSIVSQLSDWLAFIIEEEPDRRRTKAKYCKDIYQKRSAIAHGGSNTVQKEDLETALVISKSMLLSFLTTEPFKSFSTIEQLNNHMTELKFK